MKKKLLAISLLSVCGGLILSSVNKSPANVHAEESKVLVSRNTRSTFLEDEKEKTINELNKCFNGYPIYKTIPEVVALYNNYLEKINNATTFSDLTGIVSEASDAFFEAANVYWSAAFKELREYKNSVYDESLSSMNGYKEVFEDWDAGTLTPIYLAESLDSLDGIVEGLKDSLDRRLEAFNEAKIINDKLYLLYPFEYTEDYKAKLDEIESLYNAASSEVKGLVGSNYQRFYTAKKSYALIDDFMKNVFVDYKDDLNESQLAVVQSKLNGLYKTISEGFFSEEFVLSECERVLKEISYYLADIANLKIAINEAKESLQSIVDNSEYLSTYEGIDTILNGFFTQLDAATDLNQISSIEQACKDEINQLIYLHEVDIYANNLAEELEEWIYSHEVAIGNKNVEEELTNYKRFITTQTTFEDADHYYQYAIDYFEGIFEPLELEAAKEKAKQEIEEYLASLDQSSWTEEQKKEVNKDKNAYFNRIDKASSENKVNNIKIEALETLGVFEEPEVEPVGCNKGSAAIVIISILAVVGITLAISLTAGKKSKKETKKSKK